MSLSKYNAKRDFNKTAEPQSGKSRDGDNLQFVIQKHDASHLHYDFRLEMEGVLKSWAVPKGPSTDPKIKRLAMMVEDHPFDYRTFEGIIPKGEYGGGTVIVWDRGTYVPIEPIKGKKAQEQHLLEQLKSGSVKIILHGEKLRGEYALVKTHGMGENGWLLIKHNDEFADKKEITKLDKSVLSGNTIATMAKSAGETPDSELSKELAVEEEEPSDIGIRVTDLLKHAPNSKIPIGMKPMLATLVEEPFDDPDWVYEVKWDGYRALAFTQRGDVQLLSRNNKQFNEKFYPIYEILKSWTIDVVLDGEIMVISDKGVSNFGQLQNWRSEADGELVFYVFDILWFKGKDLRELTFIERQAILSSVLPLEHDQIRQSKVFKASGTDFFKAAEKMGLEGIMANR